MTLRVCFSVILLLSALFMPFWLSLTLSIVGMFLFPNFAESVAIFFVSDLLYGTKESRFLDLVFISSVIAVLSLVIIEFIKKKLRFYNEYNL